jgi:uncharacterized protein YdaU (DUF1376 family)
MWLHGGSLPNDAKVLARITGCTASRWAKIAPEVLAFFDDENGNLTSSRLKLELEKAQKKSIIRQDAGSKGGRAKSRKTKGNGQAKATANEQQNPAILHNQLGESSVLDKSKTTLTPDADSKTFSDFVAAFPKKDGVNAAASAWHRLTSEGVDPEEIMRGLEAWNGIWRRRIADPKDSFQDRHIRNAARWLEESGWRDAVPESVDGGTHTRPKTVWPGPKEIREAVVDEMGEAFAVSYLDQAEWRAPDDIIAASSIAFDKLTALTSLRDFAVLLRPKERAA